MDNFGITVKEGEEHDVVLKSDPKEDLVAMAFKIDMLNKRPPHLRAGVPGYPEEGGHRAPCPPWL